MSAPASSSTPSSVSRPVSVPSVDPEVLGQLSEVLVRAAEGRSGPPLVARVRDVDRVSVELELAPVDDVHDALVGTTIGAEWHGLGCLVDGRARSLGGPDPGPRAGEVLGRAVTALLVWRDGTAASCLRIDGGEPQVRVDRPGSATGSECSGRIVDVVRRCLGLDTAPPSLPVSELGIRVWLDRVLVVALDGLPVDDATVEALRPPVPSSWDQCRRQRAEGAWPELAVRTDLAAWMDAGMFAREALAGFPEPGDVVVDLAEVLAPATWNRLATRVDGWRRDPNY
jgi:hypothetical protein